MRINDPWSVVVDAEGGLIICDRGNHVVLRVSPDGFLSIVAGSGTVTGLESDGGPATSAFILWPNEVAVDRDGNILIADERNGAIRKVGADGIIHSLEAAPTNGTVKARVDAAPRAILAAEDGSIYYSDSTEVNRLVPSQSMLSQALPEVTSTGVVNAASFVFGPVAPGMIISVFGLNLGPIEGVTAEVSKEGFLPMSLAECRLLFDGEPAPMLFASGEQVNGVAPFSLQGQATTSVQIEYRGRLSNAVVLPVSLATPAVFGTDGEPAILNQDGTLNSQENPAARGSVVSVYATGAGQTTPPGVDGQLVAGELPLTNLRVTATMGGVPTEVLYAGGAPGLVHGALQANIRVPENLPDGGAWADLVIRIGAAQSLPGIDLAYE